MISRVLCSVLAVAIAGPCLGETPQRSMRTESTGPTALESFGVTVAENLHVTAVEPGSAADRLGLQVGDAIRDVNGFGFGNPDQFARTLRDVPAGRAVQVAISRKGTQIHLAGRFDKPAEPGVIRTVSQTVAKAEPSSTATYNPQPIVVGTRCTGCSNYGSSCGRGCASCGPYGYGPGTQYLNCNCGGPRLDLSYGIGLWDPCNAWGPHPGCGSGCGFGCRRCCR